MADNYTFNVIHRDKDVFFKAFELAFHDRKIATNWSISPEQMGSMWRIPDTQGSEYKPVQLIFHWTDYNTVEPINGFPFRADYMVCADFAWRWLSETGYPYKPDHNGDIKDGFRIYKDEHNQVNGDHTAIIAVSPHWIIFGK